MAFVWKGKRNSPLQKIAKAGNAIKTEQDPPHFSAGDALLSESKYRPQLYPEPSWLPGKSCINGISHDYSTMYFPDIDTPDTGTAYKHGSTQEQERCWHVLHVWPQQQERINRQILTYKTCKFETFIPKQKKKSPDTGKYHEQPSALIPDLIFILGEYKAIQNFIHEKSLSCYFYREKFSHAPIIVPVEQMEKFRKYYEFTSEEIIVFRKKYSYFANRDIIRMVSGPLKGFEGRIYQVGKNYKLVYGIGELALGISDIARHSFIYLGKTSPDKNSRTSLSEQYYDMIGRKAMLPVEDPEKAEYIIRDFEKWLMGAQSYMPEDPKTATTICCTLLRVIADFKSRPDLPEGIDTERLKKLISDTDNYLHRTAVTDDCREYAQKAYARLRRKAIYSKEGPCPLTPL